MAERESFRDALETQEAYRALRRAAAEALSGGLSRDILLAELEALRARLRYSGEGAKEDVVLEVMDCVVGFCSPQERL